IGGSPSTASRWAEAHRGKRAARSARSTTARATTSDAGGWKCVPSGRANEPFERRSLHGLLFVWQTRDSMLIEWTAPLVCDARNAFQVRAAAGALTRRARKGPHADGRQRVRIPSPGRSICTATRTAPLL